MTIISILSAVTMCIFLFFALTLTYKHGWLVSRTQLFELMLLTGKELKKILDSIKEEPDSETIEFLNSWQMFSQSIINTKEPGWFDFLKIHTKKKKK